MKIGIECQRIYRTAKHGMDEVALELLNQLQGLDKVNEYLVFARKGPDHEWLKETPNFKKRMVRGLTYADWEQLSLPAAVKRSGVSLLHCTANTAPLACPVPMVLTVHDIIYLEGTSFGGSPYQNFGNIYRKIIVPPAMKVAKQIITVSEFEKTIILNHFAIDPERVQVIHNGVSKRFHPRFLPEQKELFRKQYKLPSSFILFLGNTAPKKNTAGLLAAYIHYCESEKDPLPLVVTDYPKTQVDGLLQSLRKKHFSHLIHCAGYIPSAEMPLLYNCCSLFVYPSLRESFGLPVLEAMACGVPVLSSNVSAIPEVAGDAALLVDPAQPSSIAAGMRRILAESDLRTTLTHKGLTQAGLFSWEHAAVKLLDIYKRVPSS